MNKARNIIIIKLPVTLKETIIDIETTGLNPQNHEIISTAFTYKNMIQVHVNSSRNNEVYYEDLKAITTKLPCPWYAYNASFELSFLTQKKIIPRNKIIMDIQQPFREICSIAREQGIRIKWPKLNEIAKTPIIPYYGIEPQEITGKQVINEWHSFFETGNEAHLMRIAMHNAADIIKSIEALLWTAFLFKPTKNHMAPLPIEHMFTYVCDWCGMEKPIQKLHVIHKLVEPQESTITTKYIYICNECLSL